MKRASEETVITIDKKTGKVTAKSAWGTHDITTGLGAIGHTRAQLQYFLDNGRSPNPAFTKTEIAAYDAILDCGIEENAAEFLKVKTEWRTGKLKADFNNNFDVIAYLRKNGLWKEKH